MTFQHIAWFLSGLFTTCLSSAGFYLLTLVFDYMKNYHRTRLEKEKLINGFLHMNTLIEEHGGENIASSPLPQVTSSRAALFAAYKRTSAYLSCTANPPQPVPRWPPYYLRRPLLWSSVPASLEGFLDHRYEDVADAACPHCKRMVSESETASCRNGKCSSSPTQDVCNDSSTAESSCSSCVDGKRELANQKTNLTSCPNKDPGIKEDQNQTVSGAETTNPMKVLHRLKVKQDFEVIQHCSGGHTSGDSVQVSPEDGHENGFHLQMWNKVVTEYPFIVPFLESGFLEEVNRDIQCQNEKDLLHSMEQQRNSERTVARFQQFLKLRHLGNEVKQTAISSGGKEAHKVCSPRHKSIKKAVRKPESNSPRNSPPQQSSVVNTQKKVSSDMTYSLIRKKMQLKAFHCFVEENLTDRVKSSPSKVKAVKSLKTMHEDSATLLVSNRNHKKICSPRCHRSPCQGQVKGSQRNAGGFPSISRQNLHKPKTGNGISIKTALHKKSKCLKEGTPLTEMKKNVIEHTVDQSYLCTQESPSSCYRTNSEMQEHEICSSLKNNEYIHEETSCLDDSTVDPDPGMTSIPSLLLKNDSKVQNRWFQVTGNDPKTDIFDSSDIFQVPGNDHKTDSFDQSDIFKVSGKDHKTDNFDGSDIVKDDIQEPSLFTPHKVTRDDVLQEKKSNVTKLKEENVIKDISDNDPYSETSLLSTILEESTRPLVSDSACKDSDGNATLKLKDVSLIPDGLHSLPDLIKIQEELLAGSLKQNEYQTNSLSKAGQGDQDICVDFVKAKNISKTENCTAGRMLLKESKLTNKKTNRSSEKVELKKVDSSPRQPVSVGSFGLRERERPKTLRYRGLKRISLKGRINSKLENDAEDTQKSPVKTSAKMGDNDEDSTSLNSKRKTTPVKRNSKPVNEPENMRGSISVKKTNPVKITPKQMNKDVNRTILNTVQKSTPVNAVKRNSKLQNDTKNVKGSVKTISTTKTGSKQTSLDEDGSSCNSVRRTASVNTDFSNGKRHAIESPDSKAGPKYFEESKDPNKRRIVREKSNQAQVSEDPINLASLFADTKSNQSKLITKAGKGLENSGRDKDDISYKKKETENNSTKSPLLKLSSTSESAFSKFTNWSILTLSKLSGRSKSPLNISSRSKSPPSISSKRSKSPTSKLSSRSKSPLGKSSNRSKSPASISSNRSKSPASISSNRSKSPACKSNWANSPASKSSNRSKSPPSISSNRSKSPASESPNRSKSPASKSNWANSPASKPSNRSKSPTIKSFYRSKSPSRKLSHRSKALISKLSKESKSPPNKSLQASKSPIVKLTSRSESHPSKSTKESKSPVSKFSSRSKVPPSKFCKASKSPIMKMSSWSKLPSGKLFKGSKSPPSKSSKGSRSPPSKSSKGSRSPPSNWPNACKLQNRSKSPPTDMTNRSISPSKDIKNRSISPSKDMTNRSISPPKDMTNRSISPPKDMTNRSISPPTGMTNRSISPPKDMTNRSISPPTDMTNRSISPTKNMTNKSKLPPSKLTSGSKLPPSRLCKGSNSAISKLSSRSKSPPSKSSKGSKLPPSKLQNRSKSPHSKITNGSKSPHCKITNGSKSPHTKITNGSKSPHSKITNGSKSPHSKITNGSKSPHSKITNGSKATPSRLSSVKSKSPVKTLSERSKSPLNKLSKRLKPPLSLSKPSNRSKSPPCKLSMSNRSKSSLHGLSSPSNLSSRPKSPRSFSAKKSKSPCSRSSNESKLPSSKSSKLSKMSQNTLSNKSKSSVGKLSNGVLATPEISKALSRAEKPKKAGRDSKRKTTLKDEVALPECNSPEGNGIGKLMTRETILSEKFEVSLTSSEIDSSEPESQGGSFDHLLENENCKKREPVLRRSVLDDVVRQMQGCSTSSLYSVEKFQTMCEVPQGNTMSGSTTTITNLSINMRHSVAFGFSEESLLRPDAESF